jgi:glycosyltransferase involved in cell wall biosynthesis
MSSAPRTRVLFIASPRSIGADTFIHLLLLRHLSPERTELHAAVQPSGYGVQETAQTFEAIRQLPGVALKPTHFGPSLSAGPKRERLKLALQHALPVSLGFAGLVRYIRANRIQILHATDRPRDAISCAALAAATGAKALIHVHVKYGDWMSAGVKWALHRADALVGVSRFVADSLVAAGCRPKRVHSVLNAIELDRWDPTLSPLQGRAALGVAADAPLIVSVSRLFRWKGHVELIQAFARAKREVAGAKLAIVGADYPEGSGTTTELRQLAHELGVGPDVIFTGPRGDIPLLMAASDVFALASFEEPFGLVFAEAMAMKRPVIGLSNGGTPEVVEHGHSGLLSRPGEVDELAGNLVLLLRNPELRARLGEHGRAQVEARFTPARMANDFTGLYRELLSE